MPNKRQTFFSQYRGRGGPAIEPGIIKMMGEIGEEYGKGIRSIGEAIGEGLKRRYEEEKIRNENETWREISLGGTTPDTEKYNEDIMEHASVEMEAEEHAELTKRESELASARAGQYDPLKHTREIQEELDTYQDKNEKLLAIANPIRDNLDNYRSDLAEVEEERQSWFKSPYTIVKGLENLSKTRDFDRREAEIKANFLKNSGFETPQEKITQDINRLKNLKKSSEAFTPYITKLEQYRNMEIRNPGSTAGFNKLKKGITGELELEDTEKGKLVNKRAELFQTISTNMGGTLSVNIKEALSSVPPEAIKATFDVKPEQLNTLLTFGKQPLSQDAANKLAAYQDAQERLVAVQARPLPIQSDYLREKTQTEIIQDVLKNDANKKYRAGFMQSLATFAQKVKEPSINLQEFGGQTYAVYKPGDAAVQRIPKPGEMTISNQLSMLRHNRSLGKDITSGLNRLRDTHKADVSRLDSAIYKLESAKASGIIQDTGMPWNEVDDRRLEVLQKERADIDRQFTAGMGELGQDVGGTSVQSQVADIIVK